MTHQRIQSPEPALREAPEQCSLRPSVQMCVLESSAGLSQFGTVIALVSGTLASSVWVSL